MAARDTTRAIIATLKVNLGELGDGLERIVSDATDILEIEVRRQASLADHSLKDLAALGHPYRVAGGGFARVTESKQRPTVGPGRGIFRGGIGKAARQERQGALGHDIKLIHVQSGNLQEAITKALFRTDQAIMGRVGVDTDMAPYAVWLITGTRRMIPRDFMGRAAVIARGPVLRTIREGLNNLFRQLKQAA